MKHLKLWHVATIWRDHVWQVCERLKCRVRVQVSLHRKRWESLHLTETQTLWDFWHKILLTPIGLPSLLLRNNWRTASDPTCCCYLLMHCLLSLWVLISLICCACGVDRLEDSKSGIQKKDWVTQRHFLIFFVTYLMRIHAILLVALNLQLDAAPCEWRLLLLSALVGLRLHPMWRSARWRQPVIASLLQHLPTPFPTCQVKLSRFKACSPLLSSPVPVSVKMSTYVRSNVRIYPTTLPFGYSHSKLIFQLKPYLGGSMLVSRRVCQKRMSDSRCQRKCENICQRKRQDMAEKASQHVPERMREKRSEQMSQEMSQKPIWQGIC